MAAPALACATASISGEQSTPMSSCPRPASSRVSFTAAPAPSSTAFPASALCPVAAAARIEAAQRNSRSSLILPFSPNFVLFVP